MANFKVGDRVRCISDTYSSQLSVKTLIKGGEYIVQDVKICQCGAIQLKVGAVIKGDIVRFVCGHCRDTVAETGEYCYYFAQCRFVKVIEHPRVVRIKMEETEPILN